MRIGLISDIHANLQALEACLRALEARQIDRLICLGDVVGYGGQPQECCDLVRTHAELTVLGNHDAAVVGRMDYSYYRLPAREALSRHAQMLSATNLEWLESLPYTHEEGALCFSHGSPLKPENFDYLFVLEQLRELVAAQTQLAQVTFIGHSHLCKVFTFDAYGADEVLHTRFEVHPERKYIITVGSVGQPRDHDARACCGIFDTETQRYEFLRVPYDIEMAAEKIFQAGLSVSFGKRLFLGV